MCRVIIYYYLYVYKNIDFPIHMVYYEFMTNIKQYKLRKISKPEVKLDFNTFSQELSNAQYALGLLEGSQRKLPNPSLLISPLTAKEATVSSKIEGTQSTVSDVFLYEAGALPLSNDTQQVINYRVTMSFAIKELQKERPLSPHLIKTMHGILLDNVRHKGEIGKFRSDRVWIAEKAGDPIEKAIYIPPIHTQVDDYVTDLFNFINNSNTSALIKAGMAHYQFEAIHPFTDGNGRIGRLLIPLILCYKNRLTQPIMYISGYLEEHRDEYIAALHRVDETGDYNQWLAFYFASVTEQLKQTQNLIDAIYGLYDKTKSIIERRKSPFSLPFLDFIFKQPYFTVPMVVKDVKVSTRTTALHLISFLKEEGLLVETNIRRERAKIYAFDPLLQLLR